MEELMGKDVTIQRRLPGEGELAEYGTIVKCNLTGYFYSTETKQRTNPEPFEVLKDQTFQIGEGDTIPGLELALRHSRKGETLTATIASRFAFGFAGRNFSDATTEKKGTDGEQNEKTEIKSPALKESTLASIPPNQDVEYEIEILSHRGDRDLDSEFLRRFEVESIDKNEEEKTEIFNRLLTIQSLQVRKEAGNRWFSYGDYGRAAKAYSKATQISEGYFNKPVPTEGAEEKPIEEKVMETEAKKEEPIPTEDSEVVNIYVSCLNNLAACKLVQKDYYQAKELCTKVLELSPFNAKALLRAAKASLATDAYEECELCLKRLLELDKLDKNIKAAANAELVKLRKAQANYKEKSKEMQKRIAGKLFSAANGKSGLNSSDDGSKLENKDSKERETMEQESSASSALQSSSEETKNDTVTAINSYNNEGTAVKTETSVKTSNNMVFLLLTSVVVVFISIFLALTYNAEK